MTSRAAAPTLIAVDLNVPRHRAFVRVMTDPGRYWFDGVMLPDPSAVN